MTAASPIGSPAQEVTFLIIGAGFSGLGAAIRLRQEGYTDLVVLERADDVGGTWRDNTYPGCRCDVQSNLYSYSFAPKPDWSETFPSQPELWAYLRTVTTRYGLRRYLRFGHEVTGARWDAAAGRWQVTTTRGTFAGPVPHRRDRVAGRAVAARHPRYRVVPGHDHALGPLGSQLAGGRAAGRRRRHRRVRDPDRAVDPAAGRAPDGVPAHRPVRRAAHQPPGQAARSRRCTGRCRWRSGRPGSPFTGCASSWRSASSRTRRSSSGPRSPGASTWRAPSPTRCCARS